MPSPSQWQTVSPASSLVSSSLALWVSWHTRWAFQLKMLQHRVCYWTQKYAYCIFGIIHCVFGVSDPIKIRICSLFSNNFLCRSWFGIRSISRGSSKTAYITAMGNTVLHDAPHSRLRVSTHYYPNRSNFTCRRV